jgi:hypothetical protein
MEDDYYQYYNDSRQEGGNLSGDYLRVFFDDMVDAIKTIMPNAIISWDISPWPTEQDFTKWWGYFANATYIDCIHTNGGKVLVIIDFCLFKIVFMQISMTLNNKEPRQWIIN